MDGLCEEIVINRLMPSDKTYCNISTLNIYSYSLRVFYESKNKQRACPWIGWLIFLIETAFFLCEVLLWVLIRLFNVCMFVARAHLLMCYLVLTWPTIQTVFEPRVYWCIGVDTFFYGFGLPILFGNISNRAFRHSEGFTLVSVVLHWISWHSCWQGGL